MRLKVNTFEHMSAQHAYLIGSGCHAQGRGANEQEALGALVAEATELYLALGPWLAEHISMEALGRIDSDMPTMASIELRRLTRRSVLELREASEALESESLDDAVKRIIKERDEALSELRALKGGE